VKTARRRLVPPWSTGAEPNALRATSGSVAPRLWAALIIVATVGYLAFRLDSPASVTRDDSSDQRSTQAAGSSSEGLSVEFDNPLGADAHKIPLEAADTLLTTYRTAKLPISGPAAPEHVTAAWIDDTGQVAYELDNGILIIYTPDDRTAEQFADDAGEVIDLGEWEGTIIPLRGVRASAAASTESWSASLGWIEGTALVTMYGDGGQLLPELIAVAEEMRSGSI
jgi:hypothetical protein